jgi:hypothetical protein
MQMQEDIGALITKAIGGKVDIIDNASIRETARERALRDAVYAY